jgi:hypothetical protein
MFVVRRAIVSVLCHLLLLNLATLYGVEAYGDGAPRSACEHLRPEHPGWDSQDPDAVPNPYRVWFVGGAVDFDCNDTILVRINVDQDDDAGFTGFLLQGRDAGGTARGTFKPLSPGVRVMQCQSENDTATHGDGRVRRSVDVYWTAPAVRPSSPVVFKGAVTRDMKTFWTDWNIALPPKPDSKRCVAMTTTDDDVVLQTSPLTGKVAVSVDEL